jgi:hypothetical protein
MVEGGPCLMLDLLITLSARPRGGQDPACGNEVKPRRGGWLERGFIEGARDGRRGN